MTHPDTCLPTKYCGMLSHEDWDDVSPSQRPIEILGWEASLPHHRQIATRAISPCVTLIEASRLNTREMMYHQLMLLVKCLVMMPQAGLYYSRKYQNFNTGGQHVSSAAKIFVVFLPQALVRVHL